MLGHEHFAFIKLGLCHFITDTKIFCLTFFPHMQVPNLLSSHLFEGACSSPRKLDVQKLNSKNFLFFTLQCQRGFH